jgi:hypothetical protein
MTTGSEVLNYLCPNVQWAMSNDDFDTIVWVNVDEAPITKKQYEDGFAQLDAFKAQEMQAKAQAKAAAEGKLAALGLTTDDLRALGL